ncbi:MAG: DUF1552 domain-containing protein [Verrucomicrobiota bacterium]
MKSTTIPRRTFLKGLGSISIAFPLLEEMLPASAFAAESTVPVRAFNVFFGLGIPAPLQQEGFKDVLEPLAPLRDKLLIMRGIDQIRCDQRGMNAHFDGASGAFTATPPAGEAKSGGASIDQLIRRAHHPDGLPPGIVPTLAAGTFFRRSRVSRYVHSYNPDGTVAATMQERPRDLFDRVFGIVAMPKGGNDPESLRRQRLKRSVLDSVLEQYRYYTGARSPLGSASKSRLGEHLERIRELEQRAYTFKKSDPNAPDLPPKSKLLHGGLADPGGEGIDITLEELTTGWQLMADLYALAIQLDRVRFGSLTFLAAGERIRLTGKYEHNGKTRYEFNDLAERRVGGSKGCSHEYWHQFNPEKDNKQLRAHAHMKMAQIAYFLDHLANDPDSREANGKSILENSLITISTESGDGRHSDVKRELSGVFHAITSANGRFKTDQILDLNAEGIDVYNTILSAHNVSSRLGPKDRPHQALSKIRA